MYSRGFLVQQHVSNLYSTYNAPPRATASKKPRPPRRWKPWRALMDWKFDTGYKCKNIDFSTYNARLVQLFVQQGQARRLSVSCPAAPAPMHSAHARVDSPLKYAIISSARPYRTLPPGMPPHGAGGRTGERAGGGWLAGAGRTRSLLSWFWY